MLYTTTATIHRATFGDFDEPASGALIGTARGHLSDMSSSSQDPGREVVEAKFLTEPTISVIEGDVLTDEVTGISWTVLSARLKAGLGLDHYVSRVVLTKGHTQ